MTSDCSSTSSRRRSASSCAATRPSRSAPTTTVSAPRVTSFAMLPPKTDNTALACPMAVTPEMALSPNIGSDRSWVYNVAADVSDGEPTAETLAIRFANSESAWLLIP